MMELNALLVAVEITYFIQKPSMGVLPDATLISEMTGSCGDRMTISLKIVKDVIEDARIQVLGCPGAVASAMALVDLIKGKPTNEARCLDDRDVFKALEDMPSKKHHCIQLSVKTLHKAIDEYRQMAHPEQVV